DLAIYNSLFARFPLAPPRLALHSRFNENRDRDLLQMPYEMTWPAVDRMHGLTHGLTHYGTFSLNIAGISASAIAGRPPRSKKSVLGPWQFEIVAQRLAFVFATENSAPQQFRHHA